MHPDAVRLDLVQTNMVYLDLRPLGTTAPEFSGELRKHGILTLAFPGRSMRLVTHRDVGTDQTRVALDRMRSVLNAA